MQVVHTVGRYAAPLRHMRILSALALVAFAHLSAPRLSVSEPINIAVLAPSSGPLTLVAEQILVATRISTSDIKAKSPLFADINIHRIDFQAPSPSSSAFDLDRWEPIHAQLREANIDFVIGGYTPTESAILSQLTKTWNIPAILLSPIEQDDRAASLSDLVLEMGPSQTELYTTSLNTWATEQGLSDIVVLFDFEDDTSYYYGTDITAGALAPSSFSVTEVPFSRPSRPNYAFEIERVKALAPDGLIVSGLPLDSATIVRNVGAELDIPIYITTPTGWSDQIAALAQGAPSGAVALTPQSSAIDIFYGSDVWTQPTDGNIYLASRLRDELGWSNGAINKRAMQAYDAIQVIGSMWQNGGFTDALNPWLFDGKVVGYSTEFEIQENRLIIPYQITKMDSKAFSFISP